MRDRQTIKHPKVTHPSEDPRRKKAMAIAAKRRAKMTFASEGEKADYERLLRSNPLNEGLYGYPRIALHPPSRIAPLSISDIPDLTPEQRKKIQEEREFEATVKNTQGYCRWCQRETPHQEWRGQPRFCQKCGNFEKQTGSNP